MNEMTKNTAPAPQGFNVPHLPGDLPFNDEQKKWLGGFMAGLHSRLIIQSETAGAPAAAAPVAQKPITIIYGSQTGNAEGVAEQAAEEARSQGLAPVVLDMDDANLADLASAERLLVVTSTYGEGEMPDNAEALWEAISADDAPSFANTFYSVLALGDTSYDDFCLAGKLWDERLAELGAQRVTDRVDCDLDFEPPSLAWINATLPEISARGSQAGGAAAPATAPTKKAKSRFNRQNPLPAKLVGKKVLTGEASSKEICHFEISLADSGETYDAGDAVNILPLNRDDLVNELLEALNAKADSIPEGHDKNLGDLFRQTLEIRTPSKELVADIAKRSGDEKLQALVAADDHKPLNDFLWGKDVVDLLQAHPQCEYTAEALIALCKPLAARAYSISSSIKSHPGEVHLTIGSVRYQADGREHFGVCSTYLADVAEVGDEVLCYFAPNKNFSVPENPDTPMIMVGPGTGIAPFRAFLEERESTGAQGENWLFFGDRNAESDFIYRDELSAWQESGVLNRLDLAFSRDQKEKIYVQNRMLENGAELYEWLEKGAYFYVCGDAYRMAKDVDKALHQVIEIHGKKTSEQATDYVNNLKKQKRYVRDVY